MPGPAKHAVPHKSMRAHPHTHVHSCRVYIPTGLPGPDGKPGRVTLWDLFRYVKHNPELKDLVMSGKQVSWLACGLACPALGVAGAPTRQQEDAVLLMTALCTTTVAQVTSIIRRGDAPQQLRQQHGRHQDCARGKVCPRPPAHAPPQLNYNLNSHSRAPLWSCAQIGNVGDSKAGLGGGASDLLRMHRGMAEDEHQMQLTPGSANKLPWVREFSKFEPACP